MLFLTAEGTADELEPPLRYEITDLGTAGTRQSRAVAINDQGQIVGTVGDVEQARACLWDHGRVTLLGPPDRSSAAVAVNNKGQLVILIDLEPLAPSVPAAGVRREPPARRRTAFLWDKGAMIDLKIDNASGLNDQGQVVGSRDLGEGARRVILWTAGRVTDIDLGAERTALVSVAQAINNKGQVAGFSASDDGLGARAFFWDGGRVATLPGKVNMPYALNNQGQVVGSVGTSGTDYSPYLWEGDRLRMLGHLGRETGIACDINDQGQIVGSSTTARFASHAFLWEGGVLTDLNDTIPANSGWVLENAYGINESGQVVGSGQVGVEMHAFLLTRKDRSGRCILPSVPSGPRPD